MHFLALLALATLLRNPSSLPATAWACECKPGHMEFHDRVTETVLAPGAAVEIHAAEDAAAECDSAFIYSDGSTTGGPILVERILSQRRAALRAIPELRQFLLSGATGEAPGGLDRATVLVRTKLHAQSTQEILRQLDELRARLEASKPALR